MSKTILVTGSAGFIGFHTAKKLLERGDTVVGIDSFNDYYNPQLKEARNEILEQFSNFHLFRGKIEDQSMIQNILKTYDIQSVCHLAAQAGVRYSLSNPFAYEQSNICGLLTLLEAVKDKKIHNFVYASSSSVYGGNTKLPFSTTDPTDTPISFYAATKKSNELMAHVYHHLYNIPLTGLRYFTVYGPWGRPDMALYIFTKAICEDRPLQIFNNGNMKRNFTYIDDIVDGTITALDTPLGYEILNIGSENTTELMKCIKILEQTLGKKAKKEMMPLQPGDIVDTIADITQTKKLLSFEPKTSIEQGIPRFVEWYKNYTFEK